MSSYPFLPFLFQSLNLHIAPIVVRVSTRFLFPLLLDISPALRRQEDEKHEHLEPSQCLASGFAEKIKTNMMVHGWLFFEYQVKKNYLSTSGYYMEHMDMYILYIHIELYPYIHIYL